MWNMPSVAANGSHPMLELVNRLIATGEQSKPSTTQTAFRILLGAALVLAGVGHLSWSRSEFLAQVPSWFWFNADLVVVVSGIIEILIGIALGVASKYRVIAGLVAAGFFVVIFPGNIAQFVEGTDAFGLNSDAARATRLLFQPVLVAWALWSSGAWRAVGSAVDEL